MKTSYPIHKKYFILQIFDTKSTVKCENAMAAFQKRTTVLFVDRALNQAAAQ